MQKFMMVNVFDYTMPSLLTVFEPIVLKDHEYPELIIAVHEDENDCRNLHFQTINLSTSTNWYPQPYGGRLLNTHTVCQLEKDTVLVCYESKAVSRDRQTHTHRHRERDRQTEE
jgi:hypothetical protein